MVSAPSTTGSRSADLAPAAPEAAWAADLLGAVPALPAGTDPLLDSLIQACRRRGAEGLVHRPLPSRRQEDWRFTPTAPIAAVPPHPLVGGDPRPPLPTPAPGAVRLLLDADDPLAGVVLPEGISPLSAAEYEATLGLTLASTGCRGDWPVLLNKASASRVLALRVRGSVGPSLELVSDAADAAGVLPLRLLLVLEEGARLELLQVHRGAGASLTSLVSECRLAPGAHLHQAVLASGREPAVLLGHLAVEQAPGSRYTLTSICAGWSLGRLEPRILQTDGAAETRLRALQLVDADQIADLHSRVTFGGPEGSLDQLHKAVADGRGRSVFNGAVSVPRAAQRTRAAQLSRNLLLSDRARIDTKPELEIVADDVTCTHGATVSRLQEDELFYLRSRGVAADRAARLLLRGFCDEVLGELPASALAWRPRTILGGGEESDR